MESGFGTFIAIIFYLIPAMIIIWFMVNVVTNLRERNNLLKELIQKVDNLKNIDERNT